MLVAAILAILSPGAPPEVRLLFPNGGMQQSTVEIQVTGKGLDRQARLLFPAAGMVVDSSKAGRFTLSLPAELHPGIYPVWIETSDGLSDAVPFMVDTLPQSVVTATHPPTQAVTLPGVLTGTIRGNQIHEVAIEAKRGEKLTFDVWAERLGSSLDPRIVIISPAGRVAEEVDDSPGLGSDCQLVFTAPEDGRYTLQIHDSTYSVDDLQSYRIRIGSTTIGRVAPLFCQPDVPIEFHFFRGSKLTTSVSRPVARSPFFGLALLEFDQTLVPVATDPYLIPGSSVGNEITVPAAIDGILADPVNKHIIRSKPGSKIHCQVLAAAIASPLDAVLTAKEKSGKSLASQDDQSINAFTGRREEVTFASLDPAATVTVPKDGIVELSISDRLNRHGADFAYRLMVVELSSAFEVKLEKGGIVCPRKGTALLPVNVERRGYPGPISLRVEGLPEGWEASPSLISRDAKQAYLTITAPEGSADSEFETFRIDAKALEGDENNNLSRPVRWENLFGMDRFRDRERLPRAIVLEEFVITSREEATAILRVETLSAESKSDNKEAIEYAYRWESGFTKEEVKYEVLGLPKGVQAKVTPADGDASAGRITLTAEKRQQLRQPFTFVLQAAWKQGNQPCQCVAPAVVERNP